MVAFPLRRPQVSWEFAQGSDLVWPVSTGSGGRCPGRSPGVGAVVATRGAGSEAGGLTRAPRSVLKGRLAGSLAAGGCQGAGR